MSVHDVLGKVSSAIRSASRRQSLPEVISSEQSLVADLGFDSMSMALLGLALEDEFQVPILLNDWIAQHSDPLELSVGSLCAYLQTTLQTVEIEGEMEVEA